MTSTPKAKADANHYNHPNSSHKLKKGPDQTREEQRSRYSTAQRTTELARSCKEKFVAFVPSVRKKKKKENWRSSGMARRPQPCNMLPVMLLLVVAVATVVVADDEKCGNPCGNPCGVPCVYSSPPPPSLPPPEYYPPPPPVYSPPPTEYYPPPTPTPTPTANCPPPPAGGGYEPTPGYTPTPYTPTPGGYNPTPSGWFSPPYTPSYNTPPGTLYPQDPGFRPNAAAGRSVAWRAVLVAVSAVAGILAL